MAIRQLLAILVLPGTVTLGIPLWIGHRFAVEVRVPESPGAALLALAGVVLLVAGLRLFLACLRRFATEGRGTLAPWDPPRRLVLRGPYRYVRNPMISGVVFALFGEALVLRSWPHTLWAAIFLAANLIYIPLFEEPALEARFGQAYRRYRRHVPRFLPRSRPFEDRIEEPRV